MLEFTSDFRSYVREKCYIVSAFEVVMMAH